MDGPPPSSPIDSQRPPSMPILLPDLLTGGGFRRRRRRGRSLVAEREAEVAAGLAGDGALGRAAVEMKRMPVMGSRRRSCGCRSEVATSRAHRPEEESPGGVKAAAGRSPAVLWAAAGAEDEGGAVGLKLLPAAMGARRRREGTPVAGGASPEEEAVAAGARRRRCGRLAAWMEGRRRRGEMFQSPCASRSVLLQNSCSILIY